MALAPGRAADPGEETRAYLENAASEYEVLAENVEKPATAWDATLGAAGDWQPVASGRNAPLPAVAQLGDLGDATQFYRTARLAELTRPDRALRGAFSSCPKCRLTYMIEYPAMHYAVGKAAALRASRPVVIVPGRVIPEGDPRLAAAPAYGLVRPWQATPWRLR